MATENEPDPDGTDEDPEPGGTGEPIPTGGQLGEGGGGSPGTPAPVSPTRWFLLGFAAGLIVGVALTVAVMGSGSRQLSATSTIQPDTTVQVREGSGTPATAPVETAPKQTAPAEPLPTPPQ